MIKLCKKHKVIHNVKICWYQSEELSSMKPSLFFVHGIASQAKHWFGLSDYFHQNYNIYVIDRPGYGESNYFEISSTDQYTKLLEDIFITLDIMPPITYIGHSMGSYLGLCLAMHTQLIDKLILIAPFTKYVIDSKMLISRNLCKKKVLESISNSFSDDIDKNIMNQYLEDITHMEEMAIWNDFLLLANNVIEDVDLKKITMNTLLIHAVDDKVVSVRKSYQIAKFISKVKIHTIQYGGHNLFISSLPKVYSIVDNFIKNGRSDGGVDR